MLLVAPPLWPWLEPAQNLLYTTGGLGVDVVVGTDRATLNRNVYGWGERWQALVVATEADLLGGAAADYLVSLSRLPYPPQRCVLVAVEASVSRRFQQVDARFAETPLNAHLDATSVVRCTLGRAETNTDVVALAGLLRALAEHGDALRGEYVLEPPQLDHAYLAALLRRQHQRLRTVYDDLSAAPVFTVALHDPDVLLSRLTRNTDIDLPRSLATLYDGADTLSPASPPEPPAYRWLWRDDSADWRDYRRAYQDRLRALRERLTDATHDALGDSLDELELISRQRKAPLELTPRDLAERRQQLEIERDQLAKILYNTPLPQPSFVPLDTADGANTPTGTADDADSTDVENTDTDSTDKEVFAHRLHRTLASRPGTLQVAVALLLGFVAVLPSALLTTNQVALLASLGGVVATEAVVVATVRGRIRRRLSALHNELDDRFSRQLRAFADYRDAFEARLKQRSRLWLLEQQLREVTTVEEQTARERLARQFHRDAIARHKQHIEELLSDLPDDASADAKADPETDAETDMVALMLLEPPAANPLYNPLALPTADDAGGVLIIDGRGYGLEPPTHQGIRELRLQSVTPAPSTHSANDATLPQDPDPQDVTDES
ncbi:MAG: hypothetical protein U5L04_16530 [Trueperaceae bacterium]|nr:hypothetical protein [Trueperaceae bacterium]